MRIITCYSGSYVPKNMSKEDFAKAHHAEAVELFDKRKRELSPKSMKYIYGDVVYAYPKSKE